MKLYKSGPVDWFYDGWKTEDEMRDDKRFKTLFDVPCVLFDNGKGKVYRFTALETLCARWAVPYTGNADTDYDNLIAAMSGTYKAPGAAEAAEAAQRAETATTQLAALATMQVATMDLTEATSTDCATFRDYWPEWRPDTAYKYQQPIRWKGLYYRASKALTSSKVYPPDTAGESEYYPVEIAPDGIIVYRKCHGQYDQVQAGETRHYPDAEGPVYRAKVDTAYDPDTVPDNWELV